MELVEVEFSQMPKDVFLNIQKNIKKIRFSKDITQRQLAQLSGLKQQNISRIESGKIPPSLKTLSKIAEALRVDIKELL